MPAPGALGSDLYKKKLWLWYSDKSTECGCDPSSETRPSGVWWVAYLSPSRGPRVYPIVLEMSLLMKGITTPLSSPGISRNKHQINDGENIDRALKKGVALGQQTKWRQ